MSDALLGLWIMLIAADRIDLAGGRAPFALTPFLVLTPLVMASELVRRHRRGNPIRISRWTVGYAAVASALLSVALTSTFFSDQIAVSGARSILLVADIWGTLAVAVLASDRDDLARIIARGALVSLFLFAASDVMEAMWWLGMGPEILRIGPSSIYFDALQSTGPIPRLAGLVGDGNRAGFVLLCYIVMIAQGEPRRWLRRFGVTFAILLLAATISRSATLGALAALAMTLLTRRQWLTPRVLAAGALATSLLAVVLLTNPRVIDAAASVVNSPLAGRLSTKEGSAQSHVALLGRGLREATASIPRTTIGLGYGNSYLVLQDMFPGNRYGNFHSLYVTLFAESGIFALLLMLAIMATPLVLGGPWRALIAAAFAFNVFYQTIAEPVFWFVLAVAWVTMSSARLRVGAGRETPRLPVARL